MKAWQIIGCVGIAGVMASSQAWAFADDDARRAILELREQVRTLNQQMDVQRQAQLTLAGSITRLEEQNRMLTGRLEELGNRLDNQKKSGQGLDERLRALEPSVVNVNGESFVAKPEERELAEKALEPLRAQRYQEARAAIAEFLKRYPDSGYAPELAYWNGVASFAAGNYRTSINDQNDMIRRFPNGKRVPEAMLSVAASQAALGNKKAAVETLRKVLKRFPDTEAAKQAAERVKVLTKGV